MTNTERKKIIEIARAYETDGFQLFADELGWMDWMNDYTTAEDGEPITEAERSEIDEILNQIFAEAHE